MTTDNLFGGLFCIILAVGCFVSLVSIAFIRGDKRNFENRWRYADFWVFIFFFSITGAFFSYAGYGILLEGISK